MARTRKDNGEPSGSGAPRGAVIEASQDTDEPAVRPKPIAAPPKGTKALAKKLVVREGEDPWTVEDLNEVFSELNEHRERLVEALAAREEELARLIRDPGDGAGQDTADVGATNFERDHEITVVNSERAILSAIDTVLEKIQDGTFGVCDSCGEPIGKMRVMAFPRATLCKSCKQREERR